MYGKITHLSLIFRAAIVLTLGGYTHAIADEAVLNSIVQAWQRREAAVKSVRVVTTGDYMTAKGTLEKGPTRDLVTRERRVIEIDGVKLRHERSTQMWVDKTGTVEDFHIFSVYNGKQAKALNDCKRHDDGLHPMGWVLTARHHTDRANIYLFAILAHFRPLSSPFGQLVPANLSSPLKNARG